MAGVDLTRIAGNIQALNSLNSLNNINNRLATHQLRLATGKRINEASDDPAGMSIATTFDIRRQTDEAMAITLTFIFVLMAFAGALTTAIVYLSLIHI